MAIALVRQLTANTTSSGPTLTYTVVAGQEPVAGHLLVLCAVASNGRSLAAVADSRGNAYTVADSGANGTQASGVVAYSLLGTSLQAGDTLTLTWSGNANSAVNLSEWSGIAASGPLDQHANAGAAGTGAATAYTVGPTAATAQADELVIAAFGYTGSGSGTAGAGYTPLTRAQSTGTNRSVHPEYQIVAATGAQSATLTINVSVSGGVGMALATFKAAAGGGTPVGQDAALAWETRVALGADAPLAWDTGAGAGAAAPLAWGVRAASGAATGAGGGGVAAMPVVSRGVPAEASQEGFWFADGAVDADYSTFWRSYPDVPTPAAPVWLAVDLSGLTGAQRAHLVSHWRNDHASPDYYSPGSPALGRYTQPRDYTIEGNTAAGGGAAPTTGWTNLVTVTANERNSAQHDLGDCSACNWLRIVVTASNGPVGNDDIAIQWDLHDASAGNEDNLLALGDSIVAACFRAIPPGGGAWSGGIVAQRVAALATGHFPLIQDGGTGTTTLQWGYDNRAALLDGFTGRSTILGWGTNDATSGVTADDWYANLLALIDDATGLGLTPIVPRLTRRTDNATANGFVQAYNAKIATDLPVDRPDVLRGPDFYALVEDGTISISGDGLHPDTPGYEAMQAAWADWMVDTLYAATGGDPGLAWGVRAPIGDDAALAWDVAALAGTTAVGDDAALAWHARAALGDTQQTAWHMKAALGESQQVAYHVRALLFDTQQLDWRVRALLTESQPLAYHVRAALGETAPLAWVVRALAGDDAALAFRVRAPTGATAPLAWHLRARVSDDAALAWVGRALVGDDLPIVWDVAGVPGVAGNDAALAWGVRALAGATGALAYLVRAPLGDTAALVWQTRALAHHDGVVAWHTRAPSGTDADVGWRARAACGTAAALGWHVGAGLAVALPGAHGAWPTGVAAGWVAGVPVAVWRAGPTKGGWGA